METSKVEVSGGAQGMLEGTEGGRGDGHEDPLVKGMAE